MKIAVMQPYYFPYIGYFQLINAVDFFVLYDDVAYIKKGWINRNKILFQGKPLTFTLALDKSSQNKMIKDLTIHDCAKTKEKICKSLKQAYSKAPLYNEVYPWLSDIITDKETNLANYLYSTINAVMQYLNIQTKIKLSSDIEKDVSLKGQTKILSICKALGASEYLNPIGGVELYDRAVFASNQIRLRFIKSDPVIYNQHTTGFIPSLSIIDVLMFNPPHKANSLLRKFQLV